MFPCLQNAFSLILKDRFVIHYILCFEFFFLLKIWIYNQNLFCPKKCRLRIPLLIGFPLCITWCFSLAVFMIFSLHLTFDNCPAENTFLVESFWGPLRSCSWLSLSLWKLGYFSTITSLSQFSVSLSFSLLQQFI